MNKKISELRLQKEQLSLQKQPHPQALVTRVDALNFHFCLFGLEEDFSKGFYHGVIELPEDYPFSPPKIKFLTENGRFQVGKPICTTFTHYHKETWSASWNIRTIITALISFMYTNEKGIGGVYESPSRRKNLAKKSLQNNLGNPLFTNLFKQKLISRSIVTAKQLQVITKRISQREGKLNKIKKQTLTSSQFREEEQEDSNQKMPELMIINDCQERVKALISDKISLEQNNQEQGQPSKKIHFQEQQDIPIIYVNKVNEQENDHLE